MKSPIRVCVTGAAGQIGYILVGRIAKGDMFGADQPVIIHMLDIPKCAEALAGVKLELEDLASPVLAGVVASTDLGEAFAKIDYCVMVGAFPRLKGMERKDLLAKNVAIFSQQGAALQEHASPNVRVLVVGNPANTNCNICRLAAPKLPAANFTCLTRLDHNRARSQLAMRAGVSADLVERVTVWGNHSSTQYPDARLATVDGQPLSAKLSSDEDHAWLSTDFVSTVQTRGAAVIAARQASSAVSAANAIVDHVHDWHLGSDAGANAGAENWVSMGIPSDGSYDIAPGIIFSYPVRCNPGSSGPAGYEIVQGLVIDETAKKFLKATEKELREEFETAQAILKDAAAAKL